MPDERLRRLTSTGIVYSCWSPLVIRRHPHRRTSRNFFSTGNIRAILTATSVLGFIAIGQTLVILAGSLDLSVPLRGQPHQRRSPPGSWPASRPTCRPPCSVTLAVAAVIGLANGLLVSLLNVHGFIATLGMGLIISGYLATNYQGSHGSAPRSFRCIGVTFIGPVPVSTLIMLGCAAAGDRPAAAYPHSATTSTPSAATPRSPGSPASARRCRSSPPTCSARSSLRRRPAPPGPALVGNPTIG